MSNGILGRHPGRVLVVVAGVLVVLNLMYLIGREQNSSEPGTDTLPTSVQSVSPEPGTQADRRITVSVDLLDGLTGGLDIDGVCIPLDQLDGEDSPTATLTFQPQDGYVFEEFEPGTHTVTVYYRSKTDPAPEDDCDGSFEGVSTYGWRFRATA
ncbi:MAG: hypothetical protein H0V95_05620 [Actinobacteria bacterium]|nr:hypothetical protein [Actinomycetota bacterium]